MKEKVLQRVYDLVDEIKSKKEYIRLKELKEILDTDESLIQLVLEFNKAKDKYSEVSKYGEHHPDLEHVRNSLAKSKNALFTNETVSEYKALEKQIQKLLDEISRKIALSVSPKIKYPNEIGLINKH